MHSPPKVEFLGVVMFSFIFLKWYFIILCEKVLSACVSCLEVQKRIPDPMELKLWMVVGAGPFFCVLFFLQGNGLSFLFCWRNLVICQDVLLHANMQGTGLSIMEVHVRQSLKDLSAWDFASMLDSVPWGRAVSQIFGAGHSRADQALVGEVRKVSRLGLGIS